MVESQNQAQKLVGIEVAETTLTAVCLGGSGELLDSNKTRINIGQETLPHLMRVIDELKTRFGEFGKIGIAVPGLIHRETGLVAFSAHIPEHSGVDLATMVESATGVKATIENDANAAAYGEFRLGAGRGSHNLFYATLGTGIGGAFIMDGRIWRGAAGYAGEFGYVAVDADGVKLEEVASAENIVRRTRHRFHQDSTTSITKLEEDIRISDIVKAAENQDDFAQMMLERTGSYVGMAIATVINLFNIEKIVVGGEIMEAGHLVLDAIISRASELSFKPSFESTEIVAGELGENAAAIGAALLANES